MTTQTATKTNGNGFSSAKKERKKERKALQLNHTRHLPQHPVVSFPHCTVCLRRTRRKKKNVPTIGIVGFNHCYYISFIKKEKSATAPPVKAPTIVLAGFNHCHYISRLKSTTIQPHTPTSLTPPASSPGRTPDKVSKPDRTRHNHTTG